MRSSACATADRSEAPMAVRNRRFSMSGTPSEVIQHVDFPPAWIAGIELGETVHAGIVKTHDTVVLIGEIFYRGADFVFAILRGPEQPGIAERVPALRHNRQLGQVEPEVRHVVTVDLERERSGA